MPLTLLEQPLTLLLGAVPLAFTPLWPVLGEARGYASTHTPGVPTEGPTGNLAGGGPQALGRPPSRHTALKPV